MQNEITFQRGLETWIYPNRRVGRPKYQWANIAMEELWEEIKLKNRDWRYTRLDTRKEEVCAEIRRYAEIRK